jgi:hypothetical protein
MDIESGQVNVQERRGIFTVNTPMAYPFIVISNTVNRTGTFRVAGVTNADVSS